MPVAFLVRRAAPLGPVVRLGWGAFSAHPLVTTACRAPRGRGGSRWDGWCLCRLPRRTPSARVAQHVSPIMETAMSVRQPNTRRSRTPPRRPRLSPSQADAVAEVRRAGRHAEQVRREAEECAKLASLPVKQEHAAGIDVGDATHWVCVESTPDGSDTVREFPAHTPGLRQLV